MLSITGIVSIVGGALLAAAVIFGLVERSNYLGEKAARAADLAAAEAAVAAAQAADATRTRALEQAHAAEIAKLKEQANARDVSIALAPNASVCAASPPMRVLFDGLRARERAPGAGATRSPGGAGAAVP
jgi:hypothetical protein